ncbi:MAG: FixH family protein [Bacteroidetes bacterium]|nr:FixH family protein [Bacteroidota bacterium]
MSWGNKLILVFIAFAGLMSYMVYRCVQTPVDLVTKEYYKDELAYQNIIDGTQKANALSEQIRFDQNQQYIIVQLPKEMKNTHVKGSILFYNAADVKRDRHFDLQTNNDAVQELDVKTFVPGNYIVKIDWESNNNHYYSERPLTIYK